MSRCSVVLLLVALTGCRRDQAIERCRAGAATTPEGHLTACAGLFAEQGCRKALAEHDHYGERATLRGLALSCAAEYCPRFRRPPPFCSTVTGGPPPLEFLLAALALDVAPQSDAVPAVAEALRRYAADSVRLVDSHELSLEERGRLLVRLQAGEAGVRAEFQLADSGSAARWEGPHLDLLTCTRLVTSAIRAAGPINNPAALLQVAPEIPFSEVRCLLSAMTDAGVEVEFRAFVSDSSPGVIDAGMPPASP